MRELGKQTHLVLLCLVIILATVTIAFRSPSASAAQITQRKLTLVAGATGDGGSKPGGNVKHQFDFTLPTGGNVGSVKFEYCTIAAGTCTLPNGLSTTSATLEFEDDVTGFTINNTTNGSPYLTRTAASISGGVTPTFRLAGVINPVDAVDPDASVSFFVRISTYASTDTTGSPIDTGVVTASTAQPIVLTGIMPESLIFCTGETVGTTSGIPDCTTATAGDVSFNQLFSPTDTAVATSQMAASTNAGTGYAITVNGTTLTSGSNTIPAMTSAGASVPGTGQFGMNLRANTATAAGSFPYTSADLAPASDGTNLKGQPTTDYNLPDSFKFVSGETIANSAYDGAANTTLGPTNAQIYTASYIVNVAGNQLAGTYATTLTYICTPTF
jgi:hypothetical protein